MPLTTTTHRAIVSAVRDVLPPNRKRNVWAASPFEWMLREDIDFQVAGQALFERLCEFHIGTALFSSKKGLYDLSDGHHFKLHTALSEDQFVFSVATKPVYDVFVALAVMPNDASIWSIPRVELLKNLGYANNPKVSDVEFVLDMTDLPDWADRYGGTIERGLAALLRLL